MGLDDRFWGPVSDDEAAGALARLGVEGPLRVTARHRRWLFAVARFETRAGELVVKRQPRMGRALDQLRWQHRLTHHLAARGVPAARALVAPDGESAVASGDLVYEAFEVAAGEDAYADVDTWEPFRSRAHVAATGAMLARLHAAGADYRPRRRQPPAGFVVQLGPLDVRPREAVAAVAAARPAVAAYLEAHGRDWAGDVDEAYAALFRGLAPFAPALPERPLHGDWQTNNLFFDGDRLSGIIDFHQADYAPRLLDLAVAVERNCFFWNRISAGEDGAHDLGHCRALVDAYAREGGLTAAERSALADVLAVCQLQYGLSFLDYYAGVEGDREKADWAWWTFVLGHARWWGGPAGRRAHEAVAAIAAAAPAAAGRAG